MGIQKADNKIAPPQMSGILQRERLFRSLELGLERQLVWISGPGGAGKTTLVASYLESRTLPAFWYQLDEGDADPATFFYNLGLAAKQSRSRSRKQLPVLSMEYLPNLAMFSRHYFDKLFQLLRPPCVIILDNCQNLPGTSKVYEILKVGFEAAPAGISFLIVSRDEPPSPYSRMLANEHMAVINWQEMRFEFEEARELIMVRGGRDLPDHTVEQLHRKTEGWAAGLVLLIEHLRRENGDLGFLDTFTPERVSDYFASEVFDQLDCHTQDFLLKTSFLPRMTVALAEKLTGSPHCRLILTTLSRNNYFTSCHQGTEASYQYHQLFRDFLHAKAILLLPAGEVRGVRKRAAELLAGAGQIEDAGIIFAEIADWNELSALALRLAQDLLAQGRNQLLEEWLIKIPENELTREPWLLYWLGCASMTKGFANARRYLERAFPLLDANGDAAGSYLAWAGIVDTIVNEWAEFERLDIWIEALEHLRERYSEYPSREIEMRVAGSFFGALMFHLPQHKDIDTWAERIFTMIRECSDPTTRIMIGHSLALYHIWWSGNIARLGMVMDLLRPPERNDSIPPLPRIVWTTLEGLQHWISGRGKQAQINFHGALELADSSGVHLYDFLMYVLGIIAYLDEGDFRSGGHYVQEILARLDRSQHMNMAHCQYLAAWQAVLEGDIRRALEHVSSGLEKALLVGGPFTSTVVWAAWTHVLYLDGRLEEARQASLKAVQMAKEIRCPLLICRNLIVKAYFAFENGDEAAGLAALREGLPLASAMGFMNYSWWHRSMMTTVCEKALGAEIEVAYVRELITRRRLLPEKPTRYLETWPWPVRLATLGAFSISRDGTPVTFVGKVQKKPLELLKALVTLGGKENCEGELADLLWPDADGDAARVSLKTTLHRLRQLLGHDEIIGVREGRLYIDRRFLSADVWDFDSLLDEAEAQQTAGLETEANRATAKALALYQGSFLAGDAAPWLLTRRDKLAERFAGAIRSRDK